MPTNERACYNNRLRAVLGVWKPIHIAAVCDYPLAIMDASTFDPDHQTLLHRHYSFFDFHQLGGGIAHSPDQKWFYYPFQTPDEVLVFHQYSRDRFFANPHTAFYNRSCPPGTERRQSVEIRLFIYF